MWDSGAACFGDLARRGEKPSVCKWSIFLERDDCYYAFAVTLHDPSICDLIKKEGMRDNCYYTNAKFKGDVSICQKIKTEWWRNYCLAISVNKS